MKRSICVVLAMLMVCALGATAFAATTTASVKPTVSVSASAKIEVQPDVAYVSLGVTSQDASADKAKSENTEIMNKVIAAVKKAGLTEKDIKTSALNMYTQYDYSGSTPKVTGYRVENTVTLTVKEIDKLSKVVDAAMNAGANKFNNVRFDLQDDEAYYLQAVGEAVKKAEKRATTMAKAAGTRLDGVASLSTGDYRYNPIYEYAEDDVEVEEAAMDTTAESPAAPNLGTTISVGTITVSASVSAVYFLAK